MSFLWPTALAGLALVPLLVVAYLFAQRRRRAYALRFTNLALLREVMGRRPGWRRHLPALLFLLGLSALLVSLARPVAVLALPREQATIMLVIDVSGSMAATDLQPTRMEAARAAARAFIAAAPPHARIGLISFSSNAALLSPPTDDRARLTRLVDGLTPGGGTAIGDALALATRHLQQPSSAGEPSTPGIVVLLSDGQSTQGLPPEQAVVRAQQAGITVHTVGVGQRDAQVFVQGIPVMLDEQTLRAIADATGGQYFYAADTERLAQIYEHLGASITVVHERVEITALVSAMGTLLMLTAGLLSLHWFRQLP